MRSEVFAHVAELDVGIESPAEVHELVTVLDGVRRIGDQNANTGIGARQHHVFHGIQEVRIIVNARFEVMRKDRQATGCQTSHLYNSEACFLASRDDPSSAFFPRCFHFVSDTWLPLMSLSLDRCAKRFVRLLNDITHKDEMPVPTASRFARRT